MNNTSNMRFVNLDIVRIFAALLVLTIHISYTVGFQFGVGAKGVELFFMLSGFLCCLSLEHSHTSSYYKKRALSILPTYYCCLFLLYSLQLIFDRLEYGSFSSALRDGVCGYRFTRYLFLIQAITPTNDYGKWNNFHGLWTMSSFLFFYVISPWLFRFFKTFWRSFIFLFFALILRMPWVNFIESTFCYYPQSARIDLFAISNPIYTLYCFLLGMTVYFAVRDNKTLQLSLFAIFALIITDFTWYKYELVFALLLLFAYSSEPLFKNSRLTDAVQFLSKGCFTLYLIHPLLLDAIPLTFFSNRLLNSLSCYFECMFISYFFYYFIIYKVESVIKKRVS